MWYGIYQTQIGTGFELSTWNSKRFYIVNIVELWFPEDYNFNR